MERTKPQKSLYIADMNADFEGFKLAFPKISSNPAVEQAYCAGWIIGHKRGVKLARKN